jgi:replicative DNA helicase
MDRNPRLSDKTTYQEICDLDAESALLGALLLDNTIIPHVLDELGENIDLFYSRPHQLIYYGILDLFRRDVNSPIDPVVLKNFLSDRKHSPEGLPLKDGSSLLDEAGGFDTIRALWEKGSSYINYDGYIEIIRHKYILRKLRSALISTSNDIENLPYDVDKILETAEERIFDIVQERKIKKSFSTLEDLVPQQITYIEDIKDQKIVKSDIETGYQLVDEITGGFKPGQLIIIAGRPGMGKTAFALNVALNIAETGDKGVVFFSLEMSEEEIARRFIFMHSKIRGHEAMKGYITKEDLKRLHSTGSQLSRLPVYVDDTAGITPLQLKAKLRRLFTQKDYHLVIVDYLQLMNTMGNYESMNAKITMISRQLKELAKEFKVPVIALSQLSRSVENRPKKRPMLSDLRESGSIEQDADIVMFLYREDYYQDQEGAAEDKSVEINVAKNRNGPIGTKKLTFLKEFGRFESYSGRDDYPGEA